MKLGLALREVHRSERALAVKLDAVAARHHSDHAIRYVATDLAGWSRDHVDKIAGVGRHYGARSNGGVLDGWLVDEADADQLEGLRAAGLAAAAVPLYMTDLDTTAAMVAAAVDLVS